VQPPARSQGVDDNGRSQPLAQRPGGRRLVLTGGALFLISAAGLLAPGSIFVYPHSIAASEPMTVLYGFPGGWLFLVVTLALLCGCFLIALQIAARMDSRTATSAAIGVAAALAALYVGIYPSSSQDVFHNIASARTLWIYGENPLVTPPSAHPDDPLVDQVRAWRDVSSFYGPLFYAASVIPSKLAGDDVLRNLIAFKALNGLGLLLLALLVGEAAQILAPGYRAQAIVMTGWNPLLLYENVANGHNDVLMVLMIVAGLLLAIRARTLSGLIMAALAAAVKYPATPVGLIVWIWSWPRGTRSERLVLVAFALAAAAIGAAILLLFAQQVEMGKDAAIGRLPVRSLTALLDYVLRPALGGQALSAARVLGWLGFGAVFLLSLRKLGRTPRSLVQAAFWVMAALTLLTVRQIYPSYLVWFVGLGAILVGTTPWKVALLASISGLLSNIVFTDWETWSGSDDIAFLAVFVGLPAVILIARHWFMDKQRMAPATLEPAERSAGG
jgi:hypothetical protein